MQSNTGDMLGAESAEGVRRVARRGGFFQVMSILLLVCVVGGFARTLFLRTWYPVPALPPYVALHGLVMASWFVLLAIQTTLIGSRRPDLHRRLGVFGAALAAAVVIFDLNIVLRYPAHYTQSPQIATDGLPQPPLNLVIGFFWGDLSGVVVFAILVTVALSLRQRSLEAHKRLMLLAGIDLIGPALGRFTDIPLLWRQATPSAALLGLSTVALLSLPLVVVLHDLFTPRRVYLASILGALGCLGAAIGLPAVVAGTPVGHAVWNALK
jgi:hypothetical protein